MTKSAKQDTSKAPAGSVAAEAVETESSAAPDQAGATPASAADAAAGPEGATAEATTTGAADGEAAGDLDETKRKFREALERKHQARGDAAGKGGRDGAKINGAHGPAASRRSFRRKSG